jgi:hypothetical protein
MEEEVRPNSVKMDDLFIHKKNVDVMTVKAYNSILERIHKKIKTTSRQRINNEACWYIVPEFVLGLIRYDVRLCIAYLVQELRENGFNVRYTHPNLLFICWQHWVPEHVREEIKRQTGVVVDGFGKEVKKAEGVTQKPLDTRFLPVSKYKPMGRFSDV